VNELFHLVLSQRLSVASVELDRRKGGEKRGKEWGREKEMRREEKRCKIPLTLII